MWLIVHIERQKIMKTKKKLNLNKTILTIIFLSTVQIGAASGVILYDSINKNVLDSNKGTYGPILLLIIILAVLLNSFFTVKDIRIKSKYDTEYEMIKDSLGQVEKLNNTLRGQRHDFMNHLQVVYGLIEMSEYGEATDYIEKVFNDIQKVSAVLKTGNPAVNALLQAKVLFCEKRNIKIEFFITTRLLNLKVPSWEFCRILGNIIDNSIFALREVQENKVIELYLYEDLKNYGFKIKNNGPRILEKDIQKVFEPGFTTKGDMGEGMGLAISKTILEEYGGDIIVHSNEVETVFEGWIIK